MDTGLLYAINDLARATPWAHALMLGYANYGIALFALLLLAGWWTARRSGDPGKVAMALSAGAAVLLAVAVNQPLVALFDRARPYATHTDLLVLIHRTTDPSFPSDHATMAGAAAVGLWLVSRRLGLIAAAAALFMAFARVYSAAHYPADVMAGLLVGGVFALAFCLLVHRPMTVLVNTLANGRLRPLLLTD